MRRRLPLLAALVLVAATGSACADDVAPAARVGDRVITDDELLAEVAEWAGSPTLLQQLQVTDVSGAGEGSYQTGFVDFLLTTRIGFELHNEEFDALGLELTPQDLDDVRASLLGDPGVTETVLGELGTGYGESLIADVARQTAVAQELAEAYPDWQAEAFSRADIDVNPRYGAWDPRAAQVVPASGPRPAPGSDAFAGR